MRVYFLRHGRSVDAAEWRLDDDLRPLTREGLDLMRLEAAGLRRLGLVPDLIVTSPLTRARQTADIVADELGLSAALVEDERLAPGFDRDQLVAIIDAHPGLESIMVVGHEPSFSATVAKLIGGGRVQLKKGGLARVDIVERVGDMVFGVLVALLTPHMLHGE
jgi:phosphohistidine phosphatase